MSDATMILIILIVVIFVSCNDKEADQRWCDTYQLCEGNGADHEHNS